MREALWERLHGEFDILIIGGGATGAGVALAAALRGLRVALVERYDFSEGTSSRSTKLIHGGIRYLELALRKGDWRHLYLVNEALQERRRILQLAPHLCRALWLATPCRSYGEKWYYSVGVQIYDWLAGEERLARPRYFSAAALAYRIPGLRASAGAVAFPDGQFDDARFAWALVRTALAYGAIAVNHVSVVGLQKSHGRIRAAVVRDRWSGEVREIAARVIVNCAGPFADDIRRLADPQAEPLLQPSAGAHLVLQPQQGLPCLGVLVPHTEDGRVVFLLPWYNRWLLGTTDVPAQPSERPCVSEQEVAYLLRQVQPYFPDIAAMPITARWSGIRPLLRDVASTTAQAVREHRIEELHGLVTLVGGKWTTYRRMAEDLLDWLAKRGLSSRPSRSARTPLFGSPGWASVAQARIHPALWQSRHTSTSDIALSAPEDIRRHLQQYGTEALAVWNLTKDYPGRLLDGWPFLRAEVIYAVRYEMARTPMDFLARRIRLAFLDTRAAQSALPEVVSLMADELRWDSATRMVMECATREQLQTAI